MVIRLAQREDAAAIASVLYESFIEFKHQYTDAGFAATALSAEQVAARITEGPVWVGLVAGTIGGTVSAVPKDNSLYIRGMAVLPAVRGKSAGKLLLETVEVYASARNFKRLFLSTTPFLDRAIRLYENAGFQRLTEPPQDLFGTPLFTMQKLLSSRSRPDR
jgi:GNAT superfamily N-acetyltransferase